MKIYTKQGDDGETGLSDGKRVGKDDPRLEAYGTVDELNSALGLAIAGTRAIALRDILQRVQHQLFDLGADLAMPGKAEKPARIGAAQVAFLEGEIDAAAARMGPIKFFILPGGTETAARLHVARTVCRRAERLVVTLRKRDVVVGDGGLVYLNRLSDLLFTLARWANQLESVDDVRWESGK